MKTLRDHSLFIIFAVSPTGLGHLRVTDALYHGLPTDTHPLLLGSQDRKLSLFYRLVSTNIFTRWLMEIFQYGLAEKVFTFVVTRYLRSNNRLLYQQVVTVLDQRMTVAKTVLFIATHSGLAHQVAALKEKLAQEKNLQVFLMVQVTDDSPQRIWYVQEADMIFVPSQETKRALASYAKKQYKNPAPIHVSSYPVSPLLKEKLTPTEHAKRLNQVDKHSAASLHIAVPIPGAAVGTTFITEVIAQLHRLYPHSIFHVVSKDALYTKEFLQIMQKLPFVHLHVATHDREVVDMYEDIYKKETIALELTKPSEQAFKTLLDPTQHGGSLLLFSKPIGRQEYDNLQFLRKHQLIPTRMQQAFLFKKARVNATFTPEEKNEYQKLTRSWRGLVLPHKSSDAVSFLLWCLKEEILLGMMYARVPDGEETAPNGVSEFWKQTSDLLEQTPSNKAPRVEQ